jgi:hypothetical protein
MKEHAAAILKEQNRSEDSKIGLKVHKVEIFLAKILKFVVPRAQKKKTNALQVPPPR